MPKVSFKFKLFKSKHEIKNEVGSYFDISTYFQRIIGSIVIGRNVVDRIVVDQIVVERIVANFQKHFWRIGRHLGAAIGSIPRRNNFIGNQKLGFFDKIIRRSVWKLLSFGNGSYTTRLLFSFVIFGMVFLYFRRIIVQNSLKLWVNFVGL